MFASLRTFRLTAALMAALMLLSGSLPLVQHACAMAQRHEQTPDRRCARHTNDEAPAHHGLHAHGSMHAPPQAELPQAEPPCSYEAPRHDAPAACCIVQAAPGVTTNGLTVSKRSLTPVLVSAAAAMPSCDGGVSAPLFFDTGPPPTASVALHLVHSVFLN